MAALSAASSADISEAPFQLRVIWENSRCSISYRTIFLYDSYILHCLYPLAWNVSKWVFLFIQCFFSFHTCYSKQSQSCFPLSHKTSQYSGSLTIHIIFNECFPIVCSSNMRWWNFINNFTYSYLRHLHCLFFAIKEHTQSKQLPQSHFSRYAQLFYLPIFPFYCPVASFFFRFFICFHHS